MRIWPFPRIKLFKRSYEGAAGGRRWRGQPDMPVTLAAMNAARGPLARRARYLAANNALAASGVEAWVSALVGSGIKPQSGHADPSLRARLNLTFETWTDDADADGVTDYYGLQSVLARRMVIDGEAFGLMVNRGEGLRLRLIDADQVDASLNRELPGGARIIQGIEFDTSGRRTAYHILPDRSGMPFSHLALTPRRVPAEDVVHMFRPETPGQVRGISWSAPVLLRMVDLDSWRDAQLVRQKIAAMLTGFVTDVDGSGQPFEGEQTGANLVGGLEPGTLRFLNPGQDIKFSTPAGIGQEVIDFARITEREIAVGLGLPASILTGDLSDVNYSSIRAGLVEWRRRVEALQYNVVTFQALRPIWRRWAATEVLSGRVATTLEAVMPVTFITPKMAWIDPAKDVQAELDAIAGGLMSRREAVTSRGVDIEALDAEVAADNARAERLGLTFTAPTKPQTVAVSRSGTVRFSNSLSAAWYEQLASERVVVRYNRGQPMRRFERIPGRQAEALDTTVYAVAARQQVNVNWSAREEQLRNPIVAEQVAQRPRVVQSDWMAR